MRRWCRKCATELPVFPSPGRVIVGGAVERWGNARPRPSGPGRSGLGGDWPATASSDGGLRQRVVAIRFTGRGQADSPRPDPKGSQVQARGSSAGSNAPNPGEFWHPLGRPVGGLCAGECRTVQIPHSLTDFFHQVVHFPHFAPSHNAPGPLTIERRQGIARTRWAPPRVGREWGHHPRPGTLTVPEPGGAPWLAPCPTPGPLASAP